MRLLGTWISLICDVLLFLQEILQEHCFVAKDYMEELEKWEKEDYYVKHVKKYQLPYTAVSKTWVIVTLQHTMVTTIWARLKLVIAWIGNVKC